MIRRPGRFPCILAKPEIDPSATKNFSFIGYVSAIIILFLGSTAILLQIYFEPALIGVPSTTYSNIFSYCITNLVVGTLDSSSILLHSFVLQTKLISLSETLLSDRPEKFRFRP
jgi:hypothetical protein